MPDNNTTDPMTVQNSDPWDLDYSEDSDSFQESAPEESSEPEKEAAATELEDAQEEASQAKEPATKQETKEAAKKIQARLGEDLFELPADAIVKVKVRGKEVEMTAQDAINRASGDYDIQQKYNELNTEKQKHGAKLKTWEKETAEWNSFTRDITGRLNSKNPDQIIGAFDMIVERMGGDPVLFKNEFLRSLMPLVQKYNSMTESERALHERDLQVEAERRAREKSDAKLKQYHEERAQQEFQKSVESEAVEGMQKYGVSEDEFTQAYDKAKSLQESGAWPKNEKGQPREITPRDIFYVAIEDRTREQYKAGIEQIAPAVASDPAEFEKYQNLLLDRVFFDMNRGSLGTAQFYTEWLKKEIGVTAVKALQEKQKHSRSIASRQKTTKRPASYDAQVFNKDGKVNW